MSSERSCERRAGGGMGVKGVMVELWGGGYGGCIVGGQEEYL